MFLRLTNSSAVFGLATLGALALAGCGRAVEPAEDVKLLGVGNDPEEIGPAPTPYGGLIELNHVGFAGGGLPLSAMGLSSFRSAGPGLASMAPPYELVFGLSYIFDTKLRGATTFALVVPNPPPAAGTCYTQYFPEGPFDSGFNTVDVGDYVRVRNESSEAREEVVTMGRLPRDYPPEASRLSVVYQALQGYAPEARTRFVPSSDGSVEIQDMEEVVYRPANFPFGAGISLEWPGGFTSFDKPVASVPLPYSTGQAALNLPQSLGGVKMDWTGPLYTYDYDLDAYSGGESAAVSTCLEYTSPLEYGSGDAVEAPSDCVDLTPPPDSLGLYRSYQGQMYTGPWETDGGVTFTWDETTSDDMVTVAVKFLAPIDETDTAFIRRQVPLNTTGPRENWTYRDARVCESGPEDRAQYRFDTQQWTNESGDYIASLQGDPSNVIAQVVCNVPKESGSYTLEQSTIQAAYDFAVERGAAGSIFMLTRQTTADIAIPPVKDPYDQKRVVDPVYVTAKTTRIGRFFWNGASAAAGGEQ